MFQTGHWPLKAVDFTGILSAFNGEISGFYRFLFDLKLKVKKLLLITNQLILFKCPRLQTADPAGCWSCM